MLLKFVVDALSLFPALEVEAATAASGLRVVDFSMGVGFSGPVPAIARQQWDVMQLVAARKKTRFHKSMELAGPVQRHV